ncbi:MAG TPA: hypothetical protein VF808_18495 [Ktedonobacterales bacterium]
MMLKTAMRWSGLALVAGVALISAAVALVSVPNLGLSSLPVDTALFAGALLLMLGLPGMYARQADAAGWLGLAGHILLTVGAVLLIVAGALRLVNPAIKGLGESATAFLLATALLLGLGLTAIATLRAAIYPRWTGILLLGASAGFLFSFYMSEYLPPPASPVGAMVFGAFLAAALIWIGISLWRDAGSPAL